MSELESNRKHPPINRETYQSLVTETQVSDLWKDAALPEIYLQWRKEERRALLKLLHPNDTVLDMCCGDGRLIPEIIKKCNNYVGCDLDDASIMAAIRNAGRLDSSINILKSDCFNFADSFNPTGMQTFLCCLGNTFAALERSPEERLSCFYRIATRALFISVIAKGTLEHRIQYYMQNNIPFQIDEKTESITSPIWGTTGAFSSEELEKIALNVGLKKFKILPLGELGLGLWGTR